MYSSLVNKLPKSGCRIAYNVTCCIWLCEAHAGIKILCAVFEFATNFGVYLSLSLHVTTREISCSCSDRA